MTLFSRVMMNGSLVNTFLVVEKDWERPTKRAITAIIMQSDKATLKEA
jgi:hypothetical protein